MVQESRLDMVANVVKSPGSNVATSTLELMCTIFHFFPVFFVHSIGDLAHAHFEGHDFDALQHGDEERLLVVEVLNGRDQIHGLVHVEVDFLDLLCLRIYHFLLLNLFLRFS